MRRHLETRGVCAQKIVRRRDTGDYVADFYVPEMNDPIEPSKIWAGRIRRTLEDVTIVTMHDTIASWRPGHPVIYATVIFRWQEDAVA